ncbi:MAG: CinA family protein [Thermoplasmata archaeon]|nr:CinA family protein [Thermoplasmata archaeon]TFG67573.1 MAG: CinA family protein [Methanomassiliicoccus sp.]
MLAEELGQVLRSKGLTLSTAESCTGGKMGDMITAVPGSSDYYLGGVISYSDDAKASILSVDSELIVSKGAVSDEVAVQMARGCMERFSSNVAISTTGIAGPTGGTPTKPVGLVFICVCSDKASVCTRNLFLGDREDVRVQSTEAALRMTLEFVCAHH